MPSATPKLNALDESRDAIGSSGCVGLPGFMEAMTRPALCSRGCDAGPYGEAEERRLFNSRGSGARQPWCDARSPRPIHESRARKAYGILVQSCERQPQSPQTCSRRGTRYRVIAQVRPRSGPPYGYPGQVRPSDSMASSLQAHPCAARSCQHQHAFRGESPRTPPLPRQPVSRRPQNLLPTPPMHPPRRGAPDPNRPVRRALKSARQPARLRAPNANFPKPDTPRPATTSVCVRHALDYSENAVNKRRDQRATSPHLPDRVVEKVR